MCVNLVFFWCWILAGSVLYDSANIILMSGTGKKTFTERLELLIWPTLKY